MSTKKVSVIISTYNDAEYLAESVQSVLDQTYQNIECIIIDDCSTDNTVEIIENMKDERIRYIRNEKNKGLIANLNAGIALATGEYIARLDSDDYWMQTDKLEKQVEFLDEHKSYGLVGTHARVYSLSGESLFSIQSPLTDEDIRATMLVKNPFVHSSVVFRTSLARACRGYSTDETYVEDYGLWMRMGTSAKLANLNIAGVHYRLSEQGITQRNNKAQVNASIALVRMHGDTYKHRIRAIIKWRTKHLFLSLGLQSAINASKRLFS